MSIRQKIMSAAAIMILILLLVMIVFGEKGYLELRAARAEKQRILAQNAELVQENQSLLTMVDRLKNDPKYIENIARQELGMVSKDEIVIRFEADKGLN